MACETQCKELSQDEYDALVAPPGDERRTLDVWSNKLSETLSALRADRSALLAKLRAQQVSPTPEEMARDVERLTHMFRFERLPDDEWSPALSRLAAQAARVPGLEEERDLAKLRLERDGGRLADEVAVLVRQRVVDQRSPVADALLDFREPPASERSDRLVTLERDAATLRERVATLEKEVTALEDERDMLRPALEEEQEHHATAEARVKELEAQLVELNGEAQRINEMHDAEKARVRELEAQAPWAGRVDGLREAAQLVQAERAKWGGAVITACDSIGRALDTRVEHYAMSRPGVRAHLAALASQPSPAPAQGTVEAVLAAAGVDCKVSLKADDEETDYRTDVVSRVQWLVEDRERIREQRGRLLAGDTGAVECDCRRPAIWGSMPRKDCGACGGSGYLRHRAGDGVKPSTPTPPPGLREAVGPVVEAFRRDDAATGFLPGDGPLSVSLPRSKWRSLRAAYDAAKGGEAQDVRLTLRQVRADALGSGERREGWTAAIDEVAKRLTLATPPPGPGGGETTSCDDVLNAFSVEEDPAGALERYQREHPALAQDLAALAHELAQPLAEQTGPLPAEDEALINKAWTQHAAIKPTSRARIAPTPTPKVPPMARVSRAHGGHMGPKAVHDAIAYAPPPMQRDASRALYSLAADYTNLRTTRAAESLARDVSHPQPTTPTVVWEGHGLKVDSDGEIDASASGYSESGIARVLARALAEAKRENTCDHGKPKEYCADSHNDAVDAAGRRALCKLASRLGDDATGYDQESDAEALEVAIYQHVMDEEKKARAHAAEAMRERAAQTAGDVAAKYDADGLRINEHTGARIIAVTQAIRALPLE